MVRLEGITKRFGELVAVNRVDLAVNRGEFLTLLGPSGCGKTTTLGMIAGFEVPDAGAVFVGGRDVTHEPPYRRPVNTVFQNYALFPHMTVYENVAFGLRMRRLPGDEIRRRVSGMLERVGLAGLDRRYPRQLSGGQQQRVALARALAPRPAVILLDEPFSNLDSALKVPMRQEVFSILRHEGMSAILVTHDQKDAFAVSDRIAVMNAGRIEQVGTPREIYERPLTPFVASFVGATNLVPGRVGGEPPCIETEWGCIPCRDLQSYHLGTDVTVSIRPDSLRLDPEGPFVAEAVTVMYGGNSVEVLVEVPCGQRLLIHAHPGESIRPGDRVRFKALPDFIAVVEARSKANGVAP